MPFRYCTQCGFKNVYTLNEAKFCAGCGQSLNQATAGNEPQTTNAPHLQSAQANLEESTDIPNISKLEYSVDVGANNKTTIGQLINSKQSSSEGTRISNTSQASKRMTREEIEAETMRECQSARNRPLGD
jgi:hypothetical protein